MELACVGIKVVLATTRYTILAPKRQAYDRGISLPLTLHFATLYLDKNLNLYF
jgi:hypothetical protein